MRLSRLHCAALVAATAVGVSCGDVDRTGDVSTTAGALTAQDRLNACAQDPRVVTGLVSAQVCAGADIFFRETFGGNGRTCGTCHPMANNTTIDVPFIQSLPASDPLFVFETNPNLTNLETPDLRNLGGILENVDGFEDPTHKFVVRGVPHVLSLKTSVAADTGDGTTSPPIERTGWGGDGAPGDGSLRQFLNGAIKQHYPKTLARQPGVDFRFATDQELDLVLAFQNALGRLNELDLTQVNLFDSQAQQGRVSFMDPLRGRCNVCHTNAGANFIDTGRNRNFDTGTRGAQAFNTIPQFAGGFLFDAGFGGLGLAQPNFVVIDLGDGRPNGFGNGTFSTPPIIEAADTLPGFHTNAFGGSIEGVVSFYATSFFLNSPAAKTLDARFGAPLNVGPDIAILGRFLRALNIALNLDMAKQRLRASQTLLNRFGDQRVDIQKQLIQLAAAELDDALSDLTDGTSQPFYPVSVDRIGLAKTEIANALAAANAGLRGGPLSNAISRVENARDPIGANITFQLGQGNLMF
jgi:cytochrome c peroxidase